MKIVGMLPARIKSFDKVTQTAEVTVSVQTLYADTKSKEGQSPKQILTEVPVHIPSGGGWSITFDIEEGDTCVVCFSQIGYDHWLFDDLDAAPSWYGKIAPHLRRSFSSQDGFAIVGFNTLPRAIDSYAEGSQWRNTDASQNIHLKTDGSISINSPVSVDITAPKVSIVGDVEITGNADISGIVTGGSGVFGGIVVETHEHPGDGGVGSGPTTGPPIP